MIGPSAFQQVGNLWIPRSPTRVLGEFDARYQVSESGGLVTSWDSRQGVALPSTAFQPAYSATGWDGTLPALTFGPTTTALQNTGSFAAYIQDAVPIAACYTVDIASGFLAEWFENALVDFNGWFINDVGHLVFDNGTPREGTLNATGKRRICLFLTRNGVGSLDLYTYIDGVPDIVGVDVNPWSASCQTFFCGCNLTGDSPLVGKIAHMIFYTTGFHFAHDAIAADYQRWSEHIWG